MSDRFVTLKVPQPEGAQTRWVWASGLDVTLPASIAPLVSEPDTESITHARESAGDLLSELRLSAAFTPRPPASTRLPFSYQFVPLPVRTAIGHILGRVQRARTREWAAFPRWPLDLSVDFVADLLDTEPSPFAGRPAPVLLSHDLDTAEGVANLTSRFLDIEESVGARSSNYIVPCGWPIDHALLEETVSRGHEIGIHGYDHSNRTPFVAADERRERILAAEPLIQRYRITGYRAPSLLRTAELFQELERVYVYDTSIPTSGGLFPVPNNGCATARPFRLGNIVEIPLTMPRDGSLRFLGHTPREILGIWKACAERIAASGGIVSLLTHCENRFTGGAAMLSIYREFLTYLASDPRYAFSTPAKVLEGFTTSSR